MNLFALTSMNRAIYEQYGRRMIESFARHWPASVPLYVYAEDFHPETPERVYVVDLHRACPELVAFKSRHRHNPAANGRKTGAYTFRTDAVKFANKSFAVIHAASFMVAMVGADRIIWLDADTVTHAPVPCDFLAALCPDDAYIAWLAREKAYPECGFYVINPRHPGNRGFMAHWRALYTKDKVFRFPETHDSFVLERLIKDHRMPAVSISGEGAKTNHPLVNGPLGRYCDHLKGAKLKKLGYTAKSHLRGRRTEPYWTDPRKR